VISDRRLHILLICIILILPASVHGKSGLDFSEFVITADKFQRYLWREFLVEFPNIYTKRSYRVFKAGTVVFLDTDQAPTLSFFANQKTRMQKDGLVSRTSRLNMRSPSGDEFIDIIISDLGRDLQKTPLAQLLTGRAPLGLGEPGLQEKTVSISGREAGDVEMRFLIRPGRTGGTDIILNVVSENRNVFRIGENRNGESREVTWFLEDEKSFKGQHTLTAKKTKTDWMLFGSEEFYVDGVERTPAEFQRDFSDFGVQDHIIKFQEQMKELIASAMCYPDCDGEYSGREKGDASD